MLSQRQGNPGGKHLLQNALSAHSGNQEKENKFKQLKE